MSDKRQQYLVASIENTKSLLVILENELAAEREDEERESDEPGKAVLDILQGKMSNAHYLLSDAGFGYSGSLTDKIKAVLKELDALKSKNSSLEESRDHLNDVHIQLTMAGVSVNGTAIQRLLALISERDTLKSKVAAMSESQDLWREHGRLTEAGVRQGTVLQRISYLVAERDEQRVRLTELTRQIKNIKSAVAAIG